jgi:hypothetical protein
MMMPYEYLMPGDVLNTHPVFTEPDTQVRTFRLIEAGAGVRIDATLVNRLAEALAKTEARIGDYVNIPLWPACSAGLGKVQFVRVA